MANQNAAEKLAQVRKNLVGITGGDVTPYEGAQVSTVKCAEVRKALAPILKGAAGKKDPKALLAIVEKAQEVLKDLGVGMPALRFYVAGIAGVPAKTIPNLTSRGGINPDAWK